MYEVSGKLVDTGDYLAFVKVRERVAVRKQETQKFVGEGLIPRM
jgi:hypothetical protein